MATGPDSQLAIVEAKDERRQGMTQPGWAWFQQAARVCLDRHHEPPTPLGVSVDKAESQFALSWAPADERMRRAHANDQDATELGAYALSFACLGRAMGLFVVGRADQGSGADWLVAPNGAGGLQDGLPDLEDDRVLSVEVSGVDEGPIGGRLTQKREQLRRGNKPTAAGIAAVVGFERSIVGIETVNLEDT